jgi:hypothetical protein
MSEATAEEIVQAFECPSQGHEIAMFVTSIWPDLKQAIIDYGKSGKTFTIHNVPLD